MQSDCPFRDPSSVCEAMRSIAIEAGHLTLKYFDPAGGAAAELKKDGSPVTIADRAAEEVIVRALAKLLPDAPVIAEERAEAGGIPSLAGAGCFWLVDPLDGTREFITGSGEYTVNIALISRGGPVIGVVYSPARRELYAGYGDGTAVRWDEDGGRQQRIHVRKPPSAGLTVVASRHHGSADRLEAFLRDYPVERRITLGSSLKLCAVASGSADLYPRFGPTCEWDTAAGHAILHAAGGSITSLDGRPLTYGHVDRAFVNPEFVAAAAGYVERGRTLTGNRRGALPSCDYAASVHDVSQYSTDVSD